MGSSPTDRISRRLDRDGKVSGPNPEVVRMDGQVQILQAALYP